MINNNNNNNNNKNHNHTKQAAWDRPDIVAIKDELQSVLTDPR